MYQNYSKQEMYVGSPGVINNSGWYKAVSRESKQGRWSIDCSSGWCVTAEKNH